MKRTDRQTSFRVTRDPRAMAYVAHVREHVRLRERVNTERK